MANLIRILTRIIPILTTCYSFFTPVAGGTGSPFGRLTTRLASNIAVFGGTGKTGSECVYQTINQGGKAFVLARDPSKLKIPMGSGGNLGGNAMYSPNLKLFTGDITEQSAVDKVFENNDINGVVIALGGRTSTVGPTMLTDGTKRIIDAMHKHGVKRVAIVTSIGTGDSLRQAPLSFKALIYTVMRKSFKDKNNQEQLFLSSRGPGHDLDYCIVRPGGLGEGSPTGVVNVVDDEAGSIHRSDLAAFLLNSVTVPNFPYLRKAVAVSSSHGTGWVKQKGFDKPTSN